MDGVLTDFEKRYDELYGIRPSESKDRTTHFWRHFETFILSGQFRTLEKHKDADKLMQFVHELRVPVEILSSSGGGKHHEFVTEQKETWFLLDQAIRKMVVISQLESDLDNYRKLKEQYQ